MATPNLRQHSDNAFLPRDMRCLGYDAQKNCYVFTKRNEIWLGIFSARWDGARLVRLGKIQQSTLDEGVLEDLCATPEFPPDYTETSPTTSESMDSPTATSTEAELSSTEGSHIESPIAAHPEMSLSTSAWGVAGISITASGAPPPDNEGRLRKRASHIISAMRIHHPHIFHSHQRTTRQDPSSSPTTASSAERHRNSRASF